MAVLILLFVAGAILESVKLSSLGDAEIWGHLKVGDWILEDRTWPEAGIFSQAANLHWRDFSWGYDIAAAAAYRALGLRALPGLLMVLRVALAMVTFVLAGGRRGTFWMAVVLSALAQFPLLGIGPVPGGVSVVLFGLELFLLLESRRLEDPRVLSLLPVLFFVWANFDAGVVYGTSLLGLFLAVLAIEEVGRSAKWSWIEKRAARIPVARAVLIAGGCFVASLLNPYGYQLYAGFWAIQTGAVNRELAEFAAMNFHQPQDYLVLLLAMAGFLSLGLRRSRDLFLLGLLIVSGILSFHSQRENWLTTLAAIAVLGATDLRRQENTTEENGVWRAGRIPVAAGLTAAIVLIAFVLCVPHDRGALMLRVAKKFPVRACESIREQKLPPPLFNAYEWGAFLTWYLPEYPVAIDSRRGLYPEEEETDYFKVMYSEMPYRNFAPMRQARTLLMDKSGPMGDALRGVAGFHVAYEDSLSIVLLQDQRE